MTRVEPRGGERPPLLIRAARSDEADPLTELAMRSKAWWGYTPVFMERSRPILTVTPSMIDQGLVRVALWDDDIAGFHALRPLAGGGIELDLLFVDPTWIGRGVGALLFADAAAKAAALGHASLVIESDPYAEPFYVRQGARRVGWVTSSVEEGRRLPVLEVALRTAAR